MFRVCYQEGQQALLRAAATGDIGAVKRQLRGHTNINSQDEVINAFFTHFLCCIFFPIDVPLYLYLFFALFYISAVTLIYILYNFLYRKGGLLCGVLQ